MSVRSVISPCRLCLDDLCVGNSGVSEFTHRQCVRIKIFLMNIDVNIIRQVKLGLTLHWEKCPPLNTSFYLDVCSECRCHHSCLINFYINFSFNIGTFLEKNLNLLTNSRKHRSNIPTIRSISKLISPIIYYYYYVLKI